jgi:hypothetical protein
MTFWKKGLVLFGLVLTITIGFGTGVAQAQGPLVVRNLNILWNQDGQMISRTMHFTGRWVDDVPDVYLADIPMSTVANTSLDVRRLEWLWIWNNGNRIEAVRQQLNGGFIGRGQPFTVVQEDVQLLVPDITYNSRRDEHLLVYERLEKDGSVTVVAQILRPHGLKKGRPIIVARNAGEGPFPAIARPAYGAAQDIYLVVWNKGTKIMGQALRSSGALRGRPVVLVDNDTLKQPHPTVAFNTRRGDWLLTYTEPVVLENNVRGTNLYIRQLSSSYYPTVPPELVHTFNAPLVFNSFYDAELDEYVYAGFLLGRGLPFTHWIRARTNGDIREVFVATPEVLPN